MGVDEGTGPLQPRYRRPLGFGGVLDETFRLYRAAWQQMIAVSALGSLPGAVLLVLVGGSAAVVALGVLPGRAADPEGVRSLLAGLGAGFVVAALVSAVCILVWEGAVTALTGWRVRGERRSVWQALGVGLRRVLVLIGAGLVASLGVMGLALLALPLVVVGVGVLGGLTALIGLAVWVSRRPGDRPSWLTWLIILAFPFGLPLYYGVRWSLAVPAAVLERAGPIRALQRSSDLVAGVWFQTLGVWVVLSLVVYILQSIPGALVGLLGLVVGLQPGDAQGSGVVLVVLRGAASVVANILFGPLTFIAATLLFVDLRNRKEGADLAERLDLLTAGAPEPPVVA